MAEHPAGSESSQDAAQPLLSDLESQELWGSAPSLDVSLHRVPLPPWPQAADSACVPDVLTCIPLLAYFLLSCHVLSSPRCVPSRRWSEMFLSRAMCRACSRSTRPACCATSRPRAAQSWDSLRSRQGNPLVSGRLVLVKSGDGRVRGTQGQ